MRLLFHLSSGYLLARAAGVAYRLRYRDRPWLTPEAIAFLDRFLQPAHRGLEWGSGRSTLWFARRVAHLTSVESDRDWHDRVRRQLDEARLANVELVLCPDRRLHDDEATRGRPYVRVADRFADASLDFVLVDGIHRAATALAALKKVRAGGILVLDNANWYLPCASRAPSSRRESDGPASPLWDEFAGRISDWTAAWTSNGAWDTAIFIRP